MEDKISRKIYIAIGLVLCLTAVIMVKIQNYIYLTNEIMPEDYIEGYGDEGYYVIETALKNEEENTIEDNENNEEENLEIDEEKVVIENYTDSTYWNVILVNKAQHISPDYKVELGTLTNGKQVDKRIVDITNQMIRDAASEGVSLIACSAYRSYSYQTGLFNKEVSTWLAKGYSQTDAEIQASKEVALPGTSEHQLGLAIDFVTKGYTTLDQGFENTEAFKWLDENAYKYGWILRYMKGKETKTGINYEPWHWRYVGPELAEDIKNSGKCYEEFLGRDYTF